MFYDHYRRYPYDDYCYPPYPYHPYDWYTNPYSPLYDNYMSANVNQNIINQGYMNDVQQNAYVNQTASRPHPRSKLRK